MSKKRFTVWQIGERDWNERDSHDTLKAALDDAKETFKALHPSDQKITTFDVVDNAKSSEHNPFVVATLDSKEVLVHPAYCGPVDPNIF